MDTKDQLVSSIRDWIQVDNEMRSIQDRLKILRKSKKNITDNLVNVMKLMIPFAPHLSYECLNLLNC